MDQPTTTDTRTDPRPALAAALQTAVEVADRVDASQLGLPTPCHGMDVRQLLDHVGMAATRLRFAGHRVPLEEWPTEEFSLGDDWTSALRREGAGAIGAWADDARLDEDVTLPWTTMPGDDTVGTYLNEIVVHTWDLARATGQTPAWDDGVVAEAQRWIHRSLPVADRGPMWDEYREQMPDDVSFEPPFADAVAVADDASPIERLVAWNGRRP